MGRVLVCVLLLATFTYVSAISSLLTTLQTSTPENSENVQERPLITFLIRFLVETLSQKLNALARFLNLKVMIIRFLTSLYTNENLILLRSLIEYGIHLGEVSLKYLPRSVDDPSFLWVTALTEFISTNVGPGGIFYKPPEASTTESLTASSSEDKEMITNPPVIFNFPTHENSDENITRNERNVIQENQLTKSTTQESLKAYKDNLVSLDKLINARRRR